MQAFLSPILYRAHIVLFALWDTTSHLEGASDSMHEAELITGRADIFKKDIISWVKTTFWQVEFLVAAGRWTEKLMLDREHNRWSAPRLAKNIENLSVWFSLAWWQLLFCPGTHCRPVSYLFLRNTSVVASICCTVTWERLSEVGKAIFPLAASVVSNGGQQHAGMIIL